MKFDGLDSAVVNAALTAGVPASHLEEMYRVLARGPGKRRLEDVPRPSTAALPGHGALSESDEEEEEEDPATPSSRDTSMVKAIGKLTQTQICSALSESRAHRSQDPLERILDAGSHGSNAEGSGLGSGRRNAAALRSLKRMLLENPSYIYESIEKN